MATRPAGDDRLAFGPDRTPDVIVDATLHLGTIDIHTYSAGDRELTGDREFTGDPGETIPADAVQVDTSQFDQVVVVVDGVGITRDGWLVLGDREAILDRELQVPVGSGYAESESTLAVDTTLGTYRIFANRVLVTPQNEVVDLDELRAEFASNPPPTIELQPGEG